jgi:hypothetical protein
VKSVALFFLLAITPIWAGSPSALDHALRAIKMTERDLGFQKTNVEAELILPIVLHALQQPLIVPAVAADWQSRLTIATNLATLVTALEPSATPITVAGPDVLKRIVAAAAEVQPLLPKPNRAAFAAAVVEMLGEDEARPLAPELHTRRRALELQDGELANTLLDAADTFDRVALMQALATLARAIDETIPQLHDDLPVTNYPSAFGDIIIAGRGNDVHTNAAFLIVDLGGDDVYENSAGGANGLDGRPLAIVIDRAGNDRYAGNRSFTQGAGLFGIGILVDRAGDDHYEARDCSQGAGLFGAGLLVDAVGRDAFIGQAFVQGAALFGTGLLAQHAGPTTYRANKNAQGFGGVAGTGVLLDRAGHDQYTAVGADPCPWLPGHAFTLSQGFGYGMRPFAGGGTGILCDLAGDDRYVADVYGQGASYWYALGLLLDHAGNDTYEAHQYGQGAGIHLSVGGLFDDAGNDTYTAGQICQGAAHDYSVGILEDNAGDDRYTGNTTAQGAAINNSFALLLDHAGNDTYTGTDPKQSQAAGHDGGKREYGSIALLLDLAGTDIYSQGQSNNTAWLKPHYGAGLDADFWSASAGRRFAVPVFESGDNSPHSKTGRLYVVAPVDPQHPIERLFRVATSDHPDAGRAWSDLKDLGTGALEYLIPRLSSPNIMVRVKFEELVDHLDTNAIPVLIAGIRNATDDETARLCCYFLARFDEKARAAIPVVIPLLKRDKTQTTAFYTLGHLRAREVFTPATRALRSPKELVRLRATQALGKLRDRRAVPVLLRQLDDEIVHVRYAAQDALVALGKPALRPLQSAYSRASDRANPHLLEARAQLGDPQAIPLARELYRQDDPRTRAAVLRQLTEAVTLARSAPKLAELPVGPAK